MWHAPCVNGAVTPPSACTLKRSKSTVLRRATTRTRSSVYNVFNQTPATHTHTADRGTCTHALQSNSKGKKLSRHASVRRQSSRPLITHADASPGSGAARRVINALSRTRATSHTHHAKPLPPAHTSSSRPAHAAAPPVSMSAATDSNASSILARLSASICTEMAPLSLTPPIIFLRFAAQVGQY